MYYTPPPDTFEELGVVQLACSDRAPKLARQAVTAWLGTKHTACEIVTLATSELVTNAVKYTDATATAANDDRDQITLKLSQDEAVLRLVVTDPGSRCSAPARIPMQGPNLHSEHGRGLAIVDNLSRGRWGSYRMPREGHRCVWCHLDREPTPAQLEELFRAPM
ncbi:ATP-binding protein [Nonomuraea sp. NPDC051191]|uniref:ATP-binding protein n=1 Tax=Nonomuraea sp. NPDC051191 TaxID=3364372 RepID=UPI00379BCED4